MHRPLGSRVVKKSPQHRRGVRARVVNYVAALTVNAAIVMSVPRSSAVNPSPMVLRVKRRLIDGLWHEGEYVAGREPSIVIMPMPTDPAQPRRDSVISVN